MTIKLYDNNAYIFEFEAVVTDCKKTEKGYEVILDQTAFFPEEGGQACDSGTIGDARVESVNLRENQIVHTTDREVTGVCICRLDREPRLDRMQQHTGEHIVSSIIHRLFGYDNVGFHLGSDDVTCDFNGKLTKEQLERVETEANRAVFSNRAVRAYFPEKAELDRLEYRSKSDINGSVRIVDIDGIDLCACCAPHVAATGEIGLIKIIEAQSYKGGTRLHLACGMRTLTRFCSIYENIRSIAQSLSSGTENAAEYFKKYEADFAGMKLELSRTRQELLKLKAQSTDFSDTLVAFENGLDGGMLRQYANLLDGKYSRLCAVFSGNDTDGYNFAATGRVDMKIIAADMSGALPAKCGGSTEMIQGSVKATQAEIKMFFNDKAVQ